MKWTRYIFRAVFFLLTVLLLLFLNRKTNDNVATIAEFKFDRLEKFRTDSLDSKYKLRLLMVETTKFSGLMIDESLIVREMIHYLIGLLGLFVAIELGFLVLAKRNPQS